MFRVFEMIIKNINVKFGSIVAILLVLGGLTAGMGSLSVSNGQIAADKIEVCAHLLGPHLLHVFIETLRVCVANVEKHSGW